MMKRKKVTTCELGIVYITRLVLLLRRRKRLRQIRSVKYNKSIFENLVCVCAYGKAQ